MILRPETIAQIESQLELGPHCGFPWLILEIADKYEREHPISLDQGTLFLLFLLEAHDWEVANGPDFALPEAPSLKKLQTEPVTVLALQAALVELIRINNLNANANNARARLEQPYGL